MAISEKSSQDIIDDIAEDKLDVGLVGLSMEGGEFRNEDIKIKVVLRGKMIVAASKQSPLAFAKSITPEEIQKSLLVIYDNDSMWVFINLMTYIFDKIHVLICTIYLN